MAASRADRSLKGTYLKPSGRGAKPIWNFSCAVAVIVASVRPWKESFIVISSYLPPSFSWPYFRASLIAASLASAPLLQKKTFSNKGVLDQQPRRMNLRLNMIEIRYVHERFGLLLNGCDHLWMGVAESCRRRYPQTISRYHLAVAVPDHAPEPPPERGETACTCS